MQSIKIGALYLYFNVIIISSTVPPKICAMKW